MCNILILPQYVMPIREKFENMCYNNWHSWGLVTRIGDKLEVVRRVPESGEIDAKEIDSLWERLERDQEFERILHVRHNTAGATNLDNCHPYDVFFSEKLKREVYFMHNGTLYDFKSKKQQPNSTGGFTLVEDPDGASDTKNFVDRVLTPMLASQDYGNGHGDISNEFFKFLVRSTWSLNNRGLIIANDQPLTFLGDWKKTKGLKEGKEVDIYTANDDYFNDVTRGPENERRKERERKAREEERKNASPSSYSSSSVYALKDYNFNKHSVYSLTTTLDDVVNDWSLWDREAAVYLGAATYDELTELHKHKEECIAVMDWVFGDYYHLYEEYCDLDDKHHRQGAYINQLHGKLREAGVEGDILGMDNEALRNMVAANKEAA